VRAAPRAAPRLLRANSARPEGRAGVAAEPAAEPATGVGRPRAAGTPRPRRVHPPRVDTPDMSAATAADYMPIIRAAAAAALFPVTPSRSSRPWASKPRVVVANSADFDAGPHQRPHRPAHPGLDRGLRAGVDAAPPRV
jgi:hypothetical protein